ncbi:methyltransferase [Streptomyces sp. NPDC050610]|uniref:methyltransferase n=1 Tax=Streptomyces sp. NPDC050610 TaxID=3157097 RepID=UPI003423678A
MLPSNLETAVFGAIATPVLHLADRHHVFAHLTATGPARAEDIAQALRLDADTLERMLLLLTAHQILHRTPTGHYAVPPDIQPFLDPGDPHYIGGFLTHLVQETATRTPALNAYLQHGKTAVDGPDARPFASLYRDEQSTRRFLSAMWDLSYAPSQELAALGDLTTSTHLIDVGGATGPFAVAALRHAPALEATVFDLPQVEPYLEETRTAHNLAGRLHFTPGDFFTDELPEGDCIAFGYILSDWPDPTCTQLLRKAHRACRPHGHVLVMDRLFDDTRQGPLATSAMNLTMHLETQGRHRTAHEFTALLNDAGFTRCEVRKSSGDKHLVVGYHD